MELKAKTIVNLQTKGSLTANAVIVKLYLQVDR